MDDLRLALRTLAKSPSFVLTAIATLALGIGANSAIYSLLDAVRLRSLPVPNPQELQLIQIEGGNRYGVVEGAALLSYPLWEQIPARQRGFSGTFAWGGNNQFQIGSGANEHSVEGLWVSGEMFSVLGIKPFTGHFFTAQNTQTGCGTPGAVISYEFWQREFGGRMAAVGSKLIIQDQPTEIIAVTPPSFTGLEVGKNFAVALPLCSLPLYTHDEEPLRRADYSFLGVMGRLRPGWTLSQARSQLAAISPGLFRATLPAGYEALPAYYLKARLTAYSARNGVSGLRDTYETPLWLLLALTALVLLLTCANLANLMLARRVTREREMAVRLAMGASRWRLVRQLLAEGIVLATAGAICGAYVAQLLSRGIVLFLTTEDNLIYLDLSMNWHALGFTALAACLSCSIFGLIPAFRNSQTDPGEALKSGSRGVSGTRQRGRLQSALVVSQTAISLVLLVAASLFIDSFRNLLAINPGFRTNGIVFAGDFSHLPKFPPERLAIFRRSLLTQLRALPQMESAGASTHIPLDDGGWNLNFHLSSEPGDDVLREAKFTWVSTGYFKTIGMQLLKGRDFNETETGLSPRVVVVNETFVRRFLKERNALGMKFRTLSEPNYPPTDYEIVGIVRDAKYASLRDEISPEVFGSIEQLTATGIPALFFRSSAPADQLISSVRRKLDEISPGMRAEYRVMSSAIQDGLVRERLMAMLSGMFAALALLVAAVGLLGIVSYNVAARRTEIGIRMALGATRVAVVRLILRGATVLLLSGIVLGLPLAVAVGAGARSLLFGVEPNDAPTFLAASGFLLAVGLAASVLPASRAASIDPAEALRHE